MANNQPEKRQFPIFYEKSVPIAIGVLMLVVVMVVIVAISIALRYLGG
ncbi:hypothetical protein ACFLYP_04330 [Chloroflexota bacterium]